MDLQRAPPALHIRLLLRAEALFSFWRLFVSQRLAEDAPDYEIIRLLKRDWSSTALTPPHRLQRQASDGLIFSCGASLQRCQHFSFHGDGSTARWVLKKGRPLN